MYNIDTNLLVLLGEFKRCVRIVLGRVTVHEQIVAAQHGGRLNCA